MVRNTTIKSGMILNLAFILLSTVFSYAGKPKKLSDKELEKRIMECKQFEMEHISVIGDTVKIDYCLNAECTTYRSWRFSLQDIGEMKLQHEDDFYMINFTCKENNCILTPPTGVTYEPKPGYSLYVKNANLGEKLLADLKNYMIK